MATDDALSADGYCCGICSQRFHHPSLIYCCDYGHFFCQNCYRKEYSSGRDPSCPHRFCTANVYRMDKYTAKSQPNLAVAKGTKMFPEPESIARQAQMIEETKSRKSLQSFFKGDIVSTQSLTHLSRKPVHCPFPGCKKTIAVTAVDGHFKYEHKYVAFISTYFDTRNGLEFNPFDINKNQKLCIVLINILDEIATLPKEASSVKLPNDVSATTKPVMLVMATRISQKHLRSCRELYSDEEEEEDDQEEDEDDYFVGSCMHHGDKILLWVASNLPTKCKYTLAVSTPCKAIRLKYFGSVSQISDNYLKLCVDGKGLILNQPHVIGMTNGGKKPLTLDIVLHGEDLCDSDA